LDNPLGTHNSTNIHCLDTNCEFVTESETKTKANGNQNMTQKMLSLIKTNHSFD